MLQPTLKQMFEVLHVDMDISTSQEIKSACILISEIQEFNSGERDCIKACFKNGPLFDGDIPSKIERNNLIQKGYITKVVIKGEDGYNACTQKGFYAFKLIELHA
jgi:hypothetical protein